MKAKSLRSHKKQTKLEAAKRTPQENMQHKKQLEILELFGTIEFEPNWDDKTERQKP